MLHRNWQLPLLGVIVALMLAACGGRPTPEPTPTRTPRPTFTPTPEGQVANPQVFQNPTADPNQPAPTEIAILPTDTPAPPTDTPAPTPTPEVPTPTPTPQPALVYANQSVNVRSGPGVNYGRIGAMNAGQRYPATGKSPDGGWWQIDFNGQPGWVTDNLVGKEGPVETVQVAANIPAPPPVQRPAPRPTQPPPPPTQPPPSQPVQPPAPSFPFSLLKGVDRCDPNAGSTYFSGVVRDRGNNLVNGVCVHIAYFGPRNTKCSGCDAAGDGNWSFSPFGGPAPAGTSIEIFVVPCPPAGMPQGGQTQQTGFADLAPQSDKWTRTLSQSEQCTGITFIKN